MNEFMIGVNYWDSASGTDMWKKWNSAVVVDDLRALREVGVKYLRVFPLWRDFQPVKKLYAQNGNFGEYVIGEDEQPLDTNPNGIDFKMVEHFREFAKIAEKYDMKLIVSIVTGWMSGRLFVPPAIEGKNIITDPEALMWTNRFIQGLVPLIKDIPNIHSWDLGNECNDMSEAKTRYEAYAWTSLVRNSIYAADNTRIISSGMHCLSAEEEGIWRIDEMGEVVDLMSTHPYPSPTITNDGEPYIKMRGTILPTAQNEFYSGISGKPCMIQEQGTFSSLVGNPEMSAQFMRANLLSAWANNFKGYLWWCGMEHLLLNNPPYTWSMMERELGILYLDKTPKPVGREMRKLSDALSKIPMPTKKDVDAICVLPRGEKFASAAGSYILAKQAGFNVKIQNCETNIDDADAYILPCIEGWQVTYKRTTDFLLNKVKEDGAKLLVTYDGGHFTEFEKNFGIISYGVKKKSGNHTATFPFGKLNYTADSDVVLKATEAEVLATNEEGNIVLSKHKLGKGTIYFLNMALERMVFNQPNGFTPEETDDYYKIYRLFGEDLVDKYIVQTEIPYFAITQSINDDGSYTVTAINHSDIDREFVHTIKDGWKTEVLYGNLDTLPACDAVIMKVSK